MLHKFNRELSCISCFLQSNLIKSNRTMKIKEEKKTSITILCNMDALFFSNHLLAYASPQHQRARSSKQRRTIATVYYCSWEQIGRSRISFTVVHQIFSGLLERYYHGNDPLIHALHRGKARTRLPPKPFTMRDFHWRHPYPVWMFDVVFKNRMHRCGCFYHVS